MTTQQSKTYFSLGKNKFPCFCGNCGTELTKLKEQFPEGTPIPIKCETCKEKANHKARLKIFRDRYDEFMKDVPEIYKKHIQIKIDLESYQKCVNWFADKKQWALLFYGTTGTGKTTRAIIQNCKAFVFLGVRAEFIEAPRLAKRLRSDAMNGKNPEEQFNYFAGLKLLVIDDFLTEGSDVKNKMLIESLISEREKHFRKTIFTCNASTDEIFKSENGYTLRMKSRMERIQRIAIKGEDKRKL